MTCGIGGLNEARGKRRHRVWLALLSLRAPKGERCIIVGDGTAKGRLKLKEGNTRTPLRPSSDSPNAPVYSPMDPLSFTASIITVIATAATVAKHLEELRQGLRDAPDILSSLVNEISDLRIVLEACDSAVKELYQNANQTDPTTPLADAAQILDRTNGFLQELDGLIGSCLQATPSSSVFKNARVRWIRVKSRTEKIQQKLRDSKQDLLMLMESQSVSTLSGMQLIVQDVSLGIGQYHSASMDKMDEILAQLSSHMMQTQEIRSTMADLSDKITSLNFPATSSSTPSTRPPSYHENDTTDIAATNQGVESPTFVQLRASCYRKTCRPWCSCRCHIRRSVRTPALGKRFIGSLFVGYSGMPIVTETCNERQCRRRSSSRIILSYQFPEWFWSRSLLASFMTASIAGPEMLIRVSNTIPYASETYQHCMNGNVPGLLRLFEMGNASPFDLDPDGASLLRNALKFDHFNVCRLLISQGSDLYQEDHTGFSAYHFAWDAILFDPLEPQFSKRKEALLELFPQDQGGLDERQFTRIHKSILGIIGTRLEDELTISTSNIDDIDNLGRTPLHWAARRGDAAAVKLLLEFGARCDPPGMHKGGSPLLAAAKAGNEDILQMLIEHNANFEARCEDNLTPLHYAASKSYGNECVKRLLKAGADVDCVDTDNRTPLQVATQNGCIEICQTLLAAGADINSLCEDGWTPLACCIFWNTHESIRLLLEHGADALIITDVKESILHLAARYADDTTLKMLADHDLGPLDVEAKTLAGEGVYRIADEREESAEWTLALDNLIASIKINNREKTELELADLRQVETVSVTDDCLEKKIEEGGGVLVQILEVTADEDSDSDPFEDALEFIRVSKEQI